jgi:hypothetical protein
MMTITKVPQRAITQVIDAMQWGVSGDERAARHRARVRAGIAMTDRTTPRVLDLTRTSQAHRSKPRVTPKINHRSAAKCLEGAVGASRHEPRTYDFPGDFYGQKNV